MTRRSIQVSLAMCKSAQAGIGLPAAIFVITLMAVLAVALNFLIRDNAASWGFDGLPYEVKRHKLDENLWKLTVENPKTRSLIMEVEGTGDKVFAYEDSLAKLAHALSEKDLKITTFES